MPDDEMTQGPIEKFRSLVDHARETNGFVVMTWDEGTKLLSDIDVCVDAAAIVGAPA